MIAAADAPEWVPYVACAFFVLVAWIAWPRKRTTAAPPRPLHEFERHLVPLATTYGAEEAERIAAHLRSQGIVAVAKLDRFVESRRRPDYRVYSIVVASVDLERARAAFDAMVAEEVARNRPGDAPHELIERDLADAIDDDEDDEADAQYEPGPGVRRWRRFCAVLGTAPVWVPLLAAAVAAVWHWLA